MRHYKLVTVVEIGAKRQVADSAAVAHDQIGARLAAALVSKNTFNAAANLTICFNTRGRYNHSAECRYCMPKSF